METQQPPKATAPADLKTSAQRGVRLTLLGLVTSSVLAATKVIAGILGNSYALIADGIESVLDIFSSLVVWGGLKIAALPADEKHPYGYGKAESLAALVVATVLLIAAAGIAIQSVREIHTPHHAPALFTLFVLIGVIITKEIMFRVLFRAGASIGSSSMQTDAWHHRSDSLTSLAAFIGISVALLAGEGYESADDWAALLATVVIAFNGIRLFRSAWKEVLDASPPRRMIERIRSLSDSIEGVEQIEKCRVRKSGLGMYVDIHVEVDGEISVRAGHDIAHRVKDSLMESELNIHDVVVHIEPVRRSPDSDEGS